MQTRQGTISVVIPARGPCPYISYTLDSLILSEIPPIEIIIVDDGISQDAVIKIESYRTLLPIVLKANNGSGIVDALNTGIQTATGEFIARIDSDDNILPGRFKTQLNYLSQDRSISVVGSNAFYIDELGKVTGKSNYPIGLLNENPKFQVECLISHPSTMFRTENALRIGGYRKLFKWKKIQVAEDFDFWHRIAKTGKILVIPDPLIEYRQHASQISRSNVRGQLVGTLYIAAIHKLKIKNNEELVIENILSFQSIKLILTIRKGLGNKHAIRAIGHLVKSIKD